MTAPVQTAAAAAAAASEASEAAPLGMAPASLYASSRNDARPDVASAAGARGSVDDNRADAQSMATSNDHVNDKAASRRSSTKRQRVRQHCGRFWLWYLVATIIFLAIFLPILFKVIIPAIIQSILNSQGLPLQSASLECISATQLKIAFNTSLDVPLPARLSEFTVDLYNKDTSPFTPFVKLDIPGQMLNGNTTLIVPPQLTTIENEAELVRWFDQIFDSESSTVSLAGHPKVHLGELAADPRIDKTIALPGLKRFSGLGIKDLKLMFPHDKNGNNLKGTINIPNAGVFALSFGNITFDVFSGAVKLGQITTYNVVLHHGNNTLDFDGKVDLPNLVKNLGPVLDSQKAALSRGQVEINVTSTAVMVHGERIPYVEKILGRKPLTTSMSVISLFSDVLSGLLGGGSSSIVDALGDVVGNNTFLQNVMNNYNHTLSAKKAKTPSLLSKRAPNPKDALMWNMLKLGLRMKLNQAAG
ncbi:hypothetical protein E4U42_006293 [Claviceps africana]|uniref:Uncharacterized protein n=1 Tax=Claviceps africana TaxID=83212 RepID=A0A8K0JDK3_9HYPO|nr:hypothetical protein E4U42_006293 [Claviceps africana]